MQEKNGWKEQEGARRKLENNRQKGIADRETTESDGTRQERDLKKMQYRRNDQAKKDIKKIGQKHNKKEKENVNKVGRRR